MNVASRLEGKSENRFVDRYIYQWAPQAVGPDFECPLLVAQCKRMARDEKETFASGKEQLHRYLPALAARTWGSLVYGMIAVGRKVRFFVGGQARLWRGSRKYEISIETRTHCPPASDRNQKQPRLGIGIEREMTTS